MRPAQYGWNRLMCRRIILSHWRITSGKLVQVPVGRIPRSTSILVRNAVVVNRRAGLAATATVFSRYGILSLPSMIVRRQESTISSHTKILIRAADWSALPPLCRTRKQTLRQIFSIRLLRTCLKYRMCHTEQIRKKTFHSRLLPTMRAPSPS